MRSIYAGTICLGLICAVCCRSWREAKPQPRTITRAELENRIRGGWAGQMIGVSFGAPVEFVYLGKIIEKDLPWSPDRVLNCIEQDDLYVEMTFAEIMDRYGLEATTEQYGNAFKNSKYHLWHANAGARRNLNRGGGEIKAPWSGHPKYNIHANDIDFQIESDFIGLMSPGLPRESNKYCDQVGRVMNYGDGLYGGMFVCGMYAAGFFENDPRKVVEQGLACMPPGSEYAAIIRDVLAEHDKNPNEWTKCWHAIEDKWDKNDSCSDGALHPFNIDAKLNGAYIAIGLLYGGGDFSRTLEITTRCGQDADCNPSSAGGILGVMLGWEAIPENWKSGIPTIAEKKFDYTNYSFNDIIASTMTRALKNIRLAGGRIEGDQIMIPAQTPKPPKLEQWSMGIPQKRLFTDAPDWRFDGKWPAAMDVERNRLRGHAATDPGAVATLEFTGTAIAIIGHCRQDGGRADVYLDGSKVAEIDAYIPENTHDNDLWHAYRLAPRKHTVRIVTRPDADPRSAGHLVMIESAVTFSR